MNTITTNKSGYKVLTLLLISSFFIISSCARKVTFQPSSVVPAADGYVRVKQDNNDNYNIRVKIRDLASIDMLDTSKETYVVWMETRQGTTENLGQLRSSRGLFTGQRSASLETVSSFQPVRVFVTAEYGRNIQYPGKEVIMTTESFRQGLFRR
jgi:hypothetical protein